MLSNTLGTLENASVISTMNPHYHDYIHVCRFYINFFYMAMHWCSVSAGVFCSIFNHVEINILLQPVSLDCFKQIKFKLSNSNLLEYGFDLILK